MPVRFVEGKKPYTGGKAIEITDDKVINLRLRAENNLIIWDRGDNEIYVDLQLPDELRPTDAFPVGITTGRVIVDNGWDYNGTIVCFKTTSGDNIKLYYADDGKLYIDNGTGLFKQIYLKGEVDALLLALRQYVDQQLDLKQDKLIAGDRITINADGKTINADLQVSDTAYGSSWNGVTDLAPSKNAVYNKINSIDELIPSAATSSNKLADKNYVDDSINQVAAYYITKNAQGDAFATHAELSSATTFYSGGVQRTPTRNDFCIVLSDETHNRECTRYSYQNTQWEYQYTINESPMTQAQLDALNSGITANKVTTYDGYATGKQDKLTASTGISIDNSNNISVDTTVIATKTYVDNSILAYKGFSVVTSLPTLSNANENIIYALKTANGCEMYVVDELPNNQTFVRNPIYSYTYTPDQITLSESTTLQLVDLISESSTFLGFFMNGINIGYFDDESSQFAPGWYIGPGRYEYDGVYSFNYLGPTSVTVPAGTYSVDLGPGGSTFPSITLTVGNTKAWKKIGETNADLSNYFNKSTDDADDITQGTTNRLIIVSSTAPSTPAQGDAWYDTTADELKIYNGSTWNAVGGGGSGDVLVSSQANNVFTSGMKIWGGTSANYGNLTPDGNTAYLII